MPYQPEFLKLVDEFIHLANRLAEGENEGKVSAAILFAAGRYNAFNFLAHDGTAEEQDKAVDYFVAEYRKALLANLAGEVGTVIKAQG